MSIYKISNRGIVDIRFDQELYPKSNLTLLNQSINIRIKTANFEANKANFEFEWLVESFESLSMTIDLDFKIAELISTGSKRDVL